MADALLGYNGVLKYKSGGQSAGGSYTELTNCTDVSMKSTATKAASTTRASKPYSTSEPTLIDLSITFEMVIDSGDADYAVFRAAFHAKTMLAIQFYDETGGDGVQADYKITNFEQGQPLADVQKVSVELTPCRSDTAPSLI